MRKSADGHHGVCGWASGSRGGIVFVPFCRILSFSTETLSFFVVVVVVSASYGYESGLPRIERQPGGGGAMRPTVLLLILAPLRKTALVDAEAMKKVYLAPRMFNRRYGHTKSVKFLARLDAA